ncbi:MAG: NAD(P)-dependent oxidoreductase, partial [Bacteroidota bacterium]
AEHTWALLLMLIRHLQEATADVEAGHWRREPFLAGELDGKTLGILGLGRLGRIVAGYGQAFGMQVQAYDTDPSAFDRCAIPVTPVSEDQLYQTSDILSLHIPSTPANRHAVNGQHLAQMPPHAVLINTARGEVLHETDLLKALMNKELAGAALDVLDGDSAWAEMIPGRHALIDYAQDHRNLIITPHMGGYGKESIERTRRFMAQKFIKQV